MRANTPGVNAGSYHNGTAAAQSGCTTTTGCGAAAMAQNDLYEWSQALQAQLPNGQGAVCRDDSPNDGSPGAAQCSGTGTLYAVKIWWDDDRDGNFDRFVVSFAP